MFVAFLHMTTACSLQMEIDDLEKPAISIVRVYLKKEAVGPSET
jgi:hypothetical protein